MQAGRLRSTALALGLAWATLLPGAVGAPLRAQTAPQAMPVSEAIPPLLDLCQQARAAGDAVQLRSLHDRLLALPTDQGLEPVLATADALVRCEAPDAALTVLARRSPAPGPGRRAWLLLQWRAADAGLDHERAAQALRWWAEGDPLRLQEVSLPLTPQQGAAAKSRSALDQLADHLESLGRLDEAAVVLLASRSTPESDARRWARAVALSTSLDPGLQESLLERALEQAAASGAWGLVADLLDQQLAAAPAGPVAQLSAAEAQALQRRLRLSGRIDDAYGEWLLQRRFAADPARAAQLDLLLRSPRDPGGHAAQPPDPSLP